MEIQGETGLMLGVDYYPEHWPEEMLEQDLREIRDTGADTIRIGEFAWHLMEPEPGRFDFSFFDRVVEAAAAAGLKVIFGTPTATFPAWLAARHPEILSVDAWGHPRSFGGRRQYCYNAPAYRSHAGRITEAVVARYGKHSNVVAWQVDNEWGHEGSDLCFCPECHCQFQRWLERRYGSIGLLNETWGTIFWGQTYNRFDEIPMPTPTITTHNPSLQLDWARFRSDSLLGFAREMIAIVRRLKGDWQSVTHNLFGGYFTRCYDQNALAELLDVVSYDNYPVWGGLEQPISPARSALALDYIRGLKQQNYWILEQLMGAQGHTVIGYLPRPDQAKLWSWQAMARGCASLLYFRWRGMTRGAEQFCLGLLDQDNRKGRKHREAKEFFAEAREASALWQTPLQAPVACLYDFDTIWSWQNQPQSAGFDFETEFCRLYEPFYRLNVMTDVISVQKDFTGYAVLVLPAMQIVDEALADRLERFVRTGGTVVFGYRTGIKDRNNNLHFLKTPPCLVKDLCGVEIPEGESLGAAGTVPVEGIGPCAGRTGTVAVWRDLMVPCGAETLYRYGDPFYQEFAAVTVNRIGTGSVWTVAGGADAALLGDLAERILSDAGIPWLETPEGVEAVVRQDAEGRRTLLLLNHLGTPATAVEQPLKPYGTTLLDLAGGGAE